MDQTTKKIEHADMTYYLTRTDGGWDVVDAAGSRPLELRDAGPWDSAEEAEAAVRGMAPGGAVVTRADAIAAGRFSVEGGPAGAVIVSICLGATKQGPWVYVLLPGGEIDPVAAAGRGEGEEITAGQAARLIVASADQGPTTTDLSERVQAIRGRLGR